MGDTVGFVAPPNSPYTQNEAAIAAMQDSANGYLVAGMADSAPAVSRLGHAQGWLSELVAAHPQGTQRHWLALNAPVTWDQAKQLNQLQPLRGVAARVHQAIRARTSSIQRHRSTRNPLLEAAFGVILMGILGGFLVLFLVTPALAISAEQSRRTWACGRGGRNAPRHEPHGPRPRTVPQHRSAGSWGAYSA